MIIYDDDGIGYNVVSTQSVKDAIAEIEKKANSGQWSEAVIYGMNKALDIIRKHTKVGEIK